MIGDCALNLLIYSINVYITNEKQYILFFICDVYYVYYMFVCYIVGLLHYPLFNLTLIQDGFNVATALQAPSNVMCNCEL